METGRAIFRAIADFSEVRAEARKTERSLDRMVKTTKGVTGVLTGAVLGFTKGVLKLGAGVALIGAASAGLISLAAAALAVVGGLAPLAGLGVVLPGLLAGLAAGGIAFALAMKDAKTVLADLGPLLSNVQKAASAGFWAEAAQPIREMAQTLLPQVSSGMATVASAMGAMTAKFATALSGFLDGAVLKSMFDNTAKGIDNASTGASALAEIIQTLGWQGSQWLPRMGQWFADLTNRFNNFLQLAADQGKLEQWAAGGLRVLKELGSVIGSVSSILGSLMKAAENAAPGSALTVMTAALKGMADVLARPEVQNGITNVFKAAHTAMDYVQAGLGSIGAGLGALQGLFSNIMIFGGQALGKILDYIGQIMQTPGMGDGIMAFLNGLLAGVDALGPAIGPIGELIRELGPLAGELARTVGEILGQALEFLVPILADVAKTLTPIAPALLAIAVGAKLALLAFNLSTVGLIVLAIVALVMAISWLVQNWDSVVAFATQVWGGFLNWCKEVTDGFVNWWNQVWGGFGNWVGEVWGGFVNWIREIWDGFVTWIMGGVNGFVSWWNGLWGGFGSGMSDIWNGIVSAATSAWQGIVDFFSTVWALIVAGVTVFVTNFLAGWNALISFLQPVIAVFQSMFNAFGAMFTFVATLWWAVVQWIIQGVIALWTGFVTWMTAIWTTVSAGWNAMLAFIGTVLTAIGAWVSSVWNSIVAWVTGAMTALWNVYSSVWSAILSFIGSVLSSIWAVVSSVWQAVVDFISSVLSQIWGFVSSVWNNVLSFIGSVLSSIWGTVSSIWNQILGFIGGVLNSIWSTISNAWNNVVNTVTSAMGRVWSAVVDKWNEIIGWVSGIPGRITGALGDLGSLLWNAGTQIIQGLLNGLKSMWDSVAGFFSNLTASIPDWKGPAPVDKTLLTKPGKLIMGGFIDALESMYGKARKSLQRFTGSLSGTTELGVQPVLGGFDPGRLLTDANLGTDAELNHTSKATTVLNETPTAVTYDVRKLEVNNPVPEKASDSLPRAIRKLGYVGGDSSE